jgi:phage terminase Nu1 subunit (DNA packaging protein)
MTEQLRPVPDELVTRDELAEIMRVSVPTIDRLRREGMPSVTWGRRLRRFRVRDAMAWAEEQQRRAA